MPNQSSPSQPPTNAASIGLTLVLVGCAGISTQRSANPTSVTIAEPVTSGAPRASSERENRYLAWLVGTKNVAQASYLITQAPDGSCAVTARAKGVWLAGSGDLWKWRVVSRTVNPPKGFDPKESSSTLSWGVLTSAATREQVKIEWPEDREDLPDPNVKPEPETMLSQVEADTNLVASVGPWLIVLHSKYVYGGGAHGYNTTAEKLWNLETRTAVPATSMLPADSELDVIEKAAQSSLVAHSEDVDSLEGPMKFFGFLPKFDRDGRLDVGYVFGLSSCYACSGGPWGESYYSTTRVEGKPSGALAAYERAPECVARFAKEHKEDELGGWAVVPSVSQVDRVISKRFEPMRVVLRR